MVGTVKVVGPKRFRESYGRYFEDFEVGDTYEHRPGRTITEYAKIPSTSQNPTALIGASKLPVFLIIHPVSQGATIPAKFAAVF